MESDTDAAPSRHMIYRLRAKELRDIASSVPETLRADLMSIANNWDMLAEWADEERSKPE